MHEEEQKKHKSVYQPERAEVHPGGEVGFLHEPVGVVAGVDVGDAAEVGAGDGLGAALGADDDAVVVAGEDGRPEIGRASCRERV